MPGRGPNPALSLYPSRTRDRPVRPPPARVSPAVGLASCWYQHGDSSADRSSGPERRHGRPRLAIGGATPVHHDCGASAVSALAKRRSRAHTVSLTISCHVLLCCVFLSADGFAEFLRAASCPSFAGVECAAVAFASPRRHPPIADAPNAHHGQGDARGSSAKASTVLSGDDGTR